MLTAETQLKPAQVLALATEHDGVLHVMGQRSGAPIVQAYPLDDGEEPIAGTFVPRYEIVLRPGTTREVQVFRKRTKNAAADGADTELFRGCVVYPADAATVGALLSRWTMLFNSPNLVEGWSAISGATIEATKK